MNERKHADSVLEAVPDLTPEATPEAGHPLLALQRRAGNTAVNRMVQTKLTVGHAGDAYEQEADRVAADVMRRLQGGVGGDDVQRFAPPALQAKSADPLGGATVAPDLESTIGSSSGRPMDGGTQSRMEGAFGADFSGVRIHDDATAGAASESLQAHAFTTGNDVFFRKGGYDPGSSSGQELLAHELTHVVQQQGGTASRQIRRFISTETFAEKTYQSFFTQKSTAQKQIEKWLTQYGAMGVAAKAKKGDKGPPKVQIPDKKLDTGIQLLNWMIDGVDLWEQANTLETAEEIGGVTFHDKELNANRIKRGNGMFWFRIQAQKELEALEERKAAYGGTQEEVVLDEKGHLKLQEHYAGTLPSSLEKAAAIIDLAVPNVGDASELSMDLTFPAGPGVFVGAKLAMNAKRGDEHEVEIGCEIGVQGGVKAQGVGKLGATLGGYVKSKGPDAAGALKLISYGFYRRLVESNAVPAEVSSFIWGGKADEFGKKKADLWSREVEKSMLGADGDLEKPEPPVAPEAPVAPEPLSSTDAKDKKKKKAWDKRKADYDSDKAEYDTAKAEYNTAVTEYPALEKAYQDALRKNGNMVETGAYAEVAGELEVAKVAKVGASAKGSVGTRYDARSLDAKKGGAGEKNKKSDSWITQNVTSKMGTDRGAEKGIGRTSVGAALSGSFSAGPFGGKAGLEFSWMGQGKKGQKMDDYVLEGMSFSLMGSAAVPMDQLAGSKQMAMISAMIPGIVTGVRSLVAGADDKVTGTKAAGAAGNVAESAGIAISQLASMKEAFVPKFTIEPDEAGVQGAVGLELSFTYALDRTGTPEGDIIPKVHKADFELRHTKTITGTIPDTLKIELKRSSRLIGLGWQTGGSWTAK